MIVEVDDEGMRIDHLARRVYGTEKDGTVEAILAANPGLATSGLTLPVGTKVIIPDRPPATAVAAAVNPWD